jgi:redox-sensitive bicupin YhaK (pirin superfamily)
VPRTPSVVVRRAGDRFRTTTAWLDSRHGFSYGAHYDPVDTHFGVLVASNDDVVRPGHGFDPHPHRDLEIVTWVLDGSLRHEDSTGHAGTVHPGLAQRVSAGRGIRHSERNDAPGSSGDVHFVQMWVLPDVSGAEPGYEQCDIADGLDRGELLVVASGMSRYADDRAVSIRQRHAALHAARPRAGGVIGMPTAPWVHLFVARGSVELEGTGVLGTGDGARLTASDGHRVTAGPDGAEILVWEMHATLGRDPA